MKSVFRSSDHRGAIAVELALALPFLTLLLVGVADLSLMIREHQVLENAAREGARYSALSKNWVDPRNPSGSMTAIEDYIIAYCNDAGITIQRADITIDQDHVVTSGARSFTASRVTVSVLRTPLTPLGGALAGGDLQLVGEAIFRNFY